MCDVMSPQTYLYDWSPAVHWYLICIFPVSIFPQKFTHDLTEKEKHTLPETKRLHQTGDRALLTLHPIIMEVENGCKMCPSNICFLSFRVVLWWFSISMIMGERVSLEPPFLRGYVFRGLPYLSRASVRNSIQLPSTERRVPRRFFFLGGGRGLTLHEKTGIGLLASQWLISMGIPINSTSSKCR